MKKLTVLLATIMLGSLAGCVVVPTRAGVSGNSAKPDHPHGGPPGQMKKKNKQKHGKHAHGKKCGHKHKKHKGTTVYFVDGVWLTPDGVVVKID